MQNARLRLGLFILGVVQVLMCGRIASADTCGGCGTQSISPGLSNVDAYVIYVSFPDLSGSERLLPSNYATTGSKFHNFYYEMSCQSHDIAVTTVKRGSPAADTCWMAQNNMSYYASQPDYGGLNKEILEKIESQKGSGFFKEIEVICMLYRGNNWGDISGYGQLPIASGYSGSFAGVGTMQEIKDSASEAILPCVICHEYGHLLGLHDRNGGVWGELTGIYDLMYHHFLGYGLNSMVRPLCSRDLVKLD